MSQIPKSGRTQKGMDSLLFPRIQIFKPEASFTDIRQNSSGSESEIAQFKRLKIY